MKNLRKNKYFIVFTLVVFWPSVVFGQVDYNNLLSDEQAQDYSSMTQVQIKDFLQSKNSTLASYWYTGNNPAPSEIAVNPSAEYQKLRSAAEIIYNAAQEARINPKFLLALLQKEQSLIEDQSPKDTQYDFATGYFCYDGQACNPRYKGFGKQVRSAALQFRYYLDSIHEYDYQPGRTSLVDGQAVTPQNAITAAMYVYTPHLHGNKLFATIWERYAFDTPVVSGSGIFPNNALVKAKDGEDTKTIYLIHSGQKMAFDSMTALVSRFDPSKVLTVSSDEIDKYPDGPIIKYANYSVLEAPNKKRYLIDGLYKRLITDDEAFRQLGYNPAEVEEATDVDLSGFLDGADLTAKTFAPLGKLIKDTSSNGVYYVKDNVKAPIVDPDILKLDFAGQTITSASPVALDAYTKVEPVKLKDGNLIMMKGDPRVYVISSGERRLISDENTFLQLGYSWANIREVSERVMKLHRVGQPLSL